MKSKKTTNPGRTARKYVAVTVYLAFEPEAKLKDMMSEGRSMAESMSKKPHVAKATVTKSDGPYPKKAPRRLAEAKKAAVKKLKKSS